MCPLLSLHAVNMGLPGGAAPGPSAADSGTLQRLWHPLLREPGEPPLSPALVFLICVAFTHGNGCETQTPLFVGMDLVVLG